MVETYISMEWRRGLLVESETHRKPTVHNSGAICVVIAKITAIWHTAVPRWIRPSGMVKWMPAFGLNELNSDDEWGWKQHLCGVLTKSAIMVWGSETLGIIVHQINLMIYHDSCQDDSPINIVFCVVSSVIVIIVAIVITIIIFIVSQSWEY